LDWVEKTIARNRAGQVRATYMRRREGPLRAALELRETWDHRGSYFKAEDVNRGA
jgi:hypothetical protein